MMLAQPVAGQPADGFQGVRPPPMPTPRAVEPQRAPSPPVAAPAPPPLAPPPPATGQWSGESDAAGGNCGRLSLRVRREGGRLSGQADASQITAPIEGAISDDGRVSIVVRLPRTQFSFVGRLDGDRMTLREIPGQCQRTATLTRP